MTTLLSAEDLKAGRTARGITCEELARELHLGKNGERTVRRWEAEQNPISGPVQVLLGFLWYGRLPAGLCPGVPLTAPPRPRPAALAARSRPR